MMKNNYFCLSLTILYCLTQLLWAGPVPVREIECGNSGLFNYDAQEYEYKYASETKLWINDVSDDAESKIKLNGDVLIQRVAGSCQYQLKLKNFAVNGPSSSDSKNLAGQLEANVAVFSIGSNGALSSSVKFNGNEQNWVRNVKRAIISSFQLRSESELKSNDDASGVKSSVVYETDLFGRCRTTYRLRNVGGTIEINKKKALHRCSLDEYRQSPVQGDEYKSVAEYYKGHNYIENHKCEASVTGGILSKVSCKHESTMRYSSRGDNGLQAVAQLSLEFVKKNAQSSIAPLDRSAPSSIVHDYENEANEESKIDVDSFVSEICKNTEIGILDGLDIMGANHAKNFRDLISSLKSKSKSDLLKLVSDAQKKCEFGGLSVISAVVFTETDSSVEAVFDLLDQNLFEDAILQTEYPLLTAVARHRNPSAAVITKFKSYLAGKDGSFAYLRKTLLIYSTLIKTHCADRDCSANLDDWTSILVKNLGSDCSDSKNNAVVAALKSIGNVGYIKDKSVLEKCAAKKTNSLEVRVAAIQAFRRFGCSNIENLDGNYNLLKDASEDTEVRINAFKSLVKCSNSPKFQTFASKSFGDLLVKDEDYQLISYIIDFAKERGITVLLNPILANPEIKDKLQINFKEFSWNNYRFRYAVQRDAAVEVDTSVIFTSKTFVPRSFNFNLTFHGFGLHVNTIDLQVRLEGMDEILKGVFVDKLASEQLLKRLTERPEQLLDILKLLADKLAFSPEKPYASLAIRVYGAEVFFIQLDSPEKLKLISDLFGDFKNRLYNKIDLLRTVQLFNSQVKKPLVNGFEFGLDTDINMAVLNRRDGKREVKGTKTEFSLKNDLSISFFLRRHFSVEINGQNKIALRKEVTGILRQKLNMDGYRQEDGAVLYNFNFFPKKEVQLFLLEGKFYKLSSGSSYSEIKNFKVSSKDVERCNSDSFLNNVGLRFCYSIVRPEFRRGRDILKSLNNRENDIDVYEDADDFDFDQQDDDEENDDDDSDSDVDRPMIGLAGPFRYELKVSNPDLISKFTIDGKRVVNESGKSIEARLSSTTSKGVQRKLDFSYLRGKYVTGRTYKRQLSLEIKAPLTNDVRFHFSSVLNYRKKELIDYELKLNNKILSELNFHLHFTRKHKTEGQLVSNYALHAVYDSKVFKDEGTFLHLMFNINGDNKSLKSNLYIENKEMKFVEADLNLIANENAEYDSDYKLSLNGKSFFGSHVELSGPVSFGLLGSKIDVNGKIMLALVGIESDLGIKLGHGFNAEGKSHAQVHLFASALGLDHGLKSDIDASSTSRRLAIELNSPKTKASGKPRRILLEKDESEKELNVEVGIENFEIDISARQTPIASFLKKLTPEDPTLHSLNLKINRKNSENNRKDISLVLNANENEVLSGNYHRFGDLKGAFAANPEEIPAQKLGLGFDLKAIDYSTSLTTTLGVEVSKSKKLRDLSANVKLSGFLQPIFRLSELNIKSRNENGKINFSGKIERIADAYKTLEVTASGASVVVGGPSSEFKIDYVKSLSDGSKKSGKGVIKSTIKDLKNFDISISVDKLYDAKISTANSRKDETQYSHKLSLNLVHLDLQTPVEKNFEIEISKATDKTVVKSSKLEARIGKPNSLKNTDQLDLILLVNAKTVKSIPNARILSSTNTLKYKSTRTLFDIDSQSSYSFDPATGVIKSTIKSDAKFPALFDKTKEIKFLTENLVATFDLAKKTANIDYSAETNSNFFGRYLRFVKFNYQHKRGVPKLLDASFNADYKRAPTETNPAPKQRNLKFALNVDACPGKQCIDVKFNGNQEFKENCQKPFVNFKIDRKGDDSKNVVNSLYNLNVKCGEVKIRDIKLHYQHEPVKESTRPKRNLVLSSESDVQETRKIVLGVSPFTKLGGSLNGAVQWSSEHSYDLKFDYKRELEANKMKAATYSLSGNVANKYKKSCTLAIDKKSDYLNELKCSVTVPSAKDAHYGYKLSVIKPSETIYGTRNFEFSVNLATGRVILLKYKGNRNTPFDTTDDDNDPNDEREFNATASLFWDHARDKKKAIVINAKRDNYGPGQFKVFIEALDSPLIKSARLELDHRRNFNQTNIQLGFSYELKNGKSNRFDLKSKLSSDLVESQMLLEANLQRPKFNIQYSNEFDKGTGRLNKLSVRVAELLDFVVDKEYDPNNRRISLQFNDRAGGAGYKVDATSTFENDAYTVNGKIQKGGKSLSTITSVYDSMNTNLNIKVDALVTKKKYELNFGLFDEKSALGSLKQDGKSVGIASVGFEPITTNGKIVLHDIVLNLRWNRFWHEFQENLLGGIQLPSASPSEKLPAGYNFNSYFGDVYAELLSDLKPVVESIKEKRVILRQDLLKELSIHLEFYGSVSPSIKNLRQKLLDSQISNKMAPEPELPLHKRLFQRYNSLAEKLNSVHDRLYKTRARILTRLIPKLTRISYNSEDNTSAYQNNVRISKRMSRATNLYQFNAEYRNRVRRLGNAVQRFKSFLVRDIKGSSIRAILNKYRYRSIRYDFTTVGSVYNKRNIIGFGGESESLHTMKRYLLAHDTSKNRFSVILNYNDQSSSTLSVYLFGVGPIGLSSSKATVNDKPVALPLEINGSNGKSIHIGRTNNAICAHVDNEIRVCCYEDSNSCTVALTRWWSGKVNGLFGKTNNFPQKLKQEDWALDKENFRNAGLKAPSDEAVRKCYALFGKHRKSPFRDAFMAVRPNGWRKVCESAFTFNVQQNYCTLIRAFAEHSRLEYVDVNVPAECYKCQNSKLSKSYKIGENIPSAEGDESQVADGTDYVFLSLPCDSSKFAFNFDALLKGLNRDKRQLNQIYAIKIDNDETSVYQAENGQFVNFDVVAAGSKLSRTSNGVITEEAFYEAIYYAQTLFSRRVASARHLIITSCGNCLPYSARTLRKLTKQLSARNIVVNSWGDYKMSLGEDGGDEIPVGYSKNNLYVYTKGSTEINEESLDSYKVDHQADVCFRLAAKTYGSVLDLNQVRKDFVLKKVPEWFQDSRKAHTFSVKSCELVDNRKFGDFADFKFTNISHDENEENDN